MENINCYKFSAIWVFDIYDLLFNMINLKFKKMGCCIRVKHKSKNNSQKDGNDHNPVLGPNIINVLLF